MGRFSVVPTTLVCPICGNKVTIYRKTRSQRKYGHLKWFWCYKCQKQTNHFEIKDGLGYEQ